MGAWGYMPESFLDARVIKDPLNMRRCNHSFVGKLKIFGVSTLVTKRLRRPTNLRNNAENRVRMH